MNINQQIEAIKIAVSFDENLTPEQREKLLLFSGWGSVASSIHKTKDLLSESEFSSAIDATPNAFYTTPEAIKAIWKGLTHLGLKGSLTALEPGCGIGRFIELTPPELNIQWVGIERDKLSTKIARMLHPKAKIFNASFEDFSCKSSFDLIVGNVPFGDIKIACLEFPGLSIHNYFIAKSLHLLRPGGILALITSTGTLNNVRFCHQLAKTSTLIGAMRLPGTTFKAENTSVTTDLIVLQKLEPGQQSDRTWIGRNRPHEVALVNDKLVEYKYRGWQWSEHLDKHGLQDFDQYLPWIYLKNPALMLGVPCTDPLYPSERAGLAGDGRNLPQAITDAFLSFTPCYIESKVRAVFSALPEKLMQTPIGSFELLEGKVFQKTSKLSVCEIVDPGMVSRIKDAIALHSHLEELMAGQIADWETHKLDLYRVRLNSLYDDFIKAWEPINKQEWLVSDYRFYKLAALEIVSKNGRKVSYTKADIFWQRTAKPYTIPERVDTPEEAIAHCLAQKGVLDLTLVANLLGSAYKLEDLSEKELIFYDPELNQWVLRDEYLSGIDVREKLEAAKLAKLERNVTALTQIQPLYTLPDASNEIRVQVAAAIGTERCDMRLESRFKVSLGCAWVNAQIYQQFLCHITDIDAKVAFLESVGAYSVKLGSIAKNSTGNTTIYGTREKTAGELFELALNMKKPVVYKKVQNLTVVDEKATEDAQAKLKRIEEEFQEWVFSDADRATYLTETFNQTMNSTVPRQFDGSFLQMPGCNPEFAWRPSQLNAIWRAIAQKQALFAHAVGAGKTATAIGAIMEMKRMGLVHKPILVVLKSTLTQVVKEFRRLYPMARLKVAEENSFSVQNRKRFCTEIATTDFDCAIVTHNQFTLGLNLSPEAIAQFIHEELEEVEQALSEAKSSGHKIKHIASARNRLVNRLILVNKQLTERQDENIYWEQTGIDCLFIDESHYFKKIPFHTKTGGISGVPVGTSQRAWDAILKIHWLINNDKRVYFMTGTPVGNTIVESWINLKMLAPKLLEKKKIAHFDSCLAAFFEVENKYEVTPNGYKARERCSKTKNLSKYMQIWRAIADIKTASMLNLPVPETEYVQVYCPPSKEQASYLSYLAERAKPPIADGDNMLNIYTDARAAIGLDLRLRDAEAANFIDSKVNQCCVNAYKIWQASTSVRGVQSIFCDFSAPKKGDIFSVPVYMRDALIALGIPPQEIAFVNDFETDAKKELLFEALQEGEIRIVFGSTSKLGTGTNFQTRHIASHRLDCPWRPCDVEQCEGRLKRSGNLFHKGLLFRYATEGTGRLPGFDAFVWQTIIAKLTSINEVMEGKDIDECVDIDPFLMSAEELMAIATGDPRFKRRLDIQKRIQELESAQREVNQLLFGIKSDITRYQTIERDCLSRIPAIENNLLQWNKRPCKMQQGDFDNLIQRLKGQKINFQKSRTIQAYGIGQIGIFQIKSVYDGRRYSLSLVTNIYSDGEQLRYRFYQEPSVNSKEVERLLTDAPSILEQELASCRQKLENAKVQLQTLAEFQGEEFAEIEELIELKQELKEIEAALNPNPKQIEEELDPEKEEDADPFSYWEERSGLAAPYKQVDKDIISELKDRLNNVESWEATLIEIIQVAEDSGMF